MMPLELGLGPTNISRSDLERLDCLGHHLVDNDLCWLDIVNDGCSLSNQERSLFDGRQPGLGTMIN